MLPNASLKSIIDEEISLEGLEGSTLDSLWNHIAIRLKMKMPLPPKLMCTVWTLIIRNTDFEFFLLLSERKPFTFFERLGKIDAESGMPIQPSEYPGHRFAYRLVEANGVRGSCEEYDTRTPIPREELQTISCSEAELRYGRKFVIVASQRMRESFLIIPNCTVELTGMQYCILEWIGRSRFNGETSHGKFSLVEVTGDSSSLFYHRKVLSGAKLITRQNLSIRVEDISIQGMVFHLPRYYMEMKTKQLTIVERVVNELKQRDNYMADYEEIKMLVLKKSEAGKVFRTPEFQRFIKTDESVQFRTLYPDAPKTAYMTKRGEEKLVRVMRLIDPGADVYDAWNRETTEEVGMDGKDGFLAGADSNSLYVDVPLLQIAYNVVAHHGGKGISQSEMAQEMGLDKLNARGVVKNLLKLKAIESMAVDEGRQRTSKFFIPGNSQRTAVFEKEMSQYVSNQLNVIVSKRQQQQLSSTAIKSDPEQEGGSGKLNTTSDFSLGNEDGNLDTSLATVQSASESSVFDSTLQDNIIIDVMLSDKLMMKMAQKGLSSALKSRLVSEQMLRRCNFIIDLVKQEEAIEPRAILNRLKQAEQKTGNQYTACNKSLMRLIGRLATDKLVKIANVTMRREDREFHFVFICDSKITLDHPGLQSKLNMAKTRIVLQTQTSVTVPEEPVVSVEPRGYHVCLPKCPRMKLFHEYLFYTTYVQPRDARDIKIKDLKQIQLDAIDPNDIWPIYSDTNDWKMFVPPLNLYDGYGPGWVLLTDAVVRMPLIIFCSIFTFSFYTSSLDYYLKHPIRKYIILKDLPDAIRVQLFARRRYVQATLELTKLLCYAGLVQMGPQLRKTRDQTYIYLNRHASLLNTTTSKDSYNEIEARKYPILRFKFETMDDVEEYWDTLYEIAISTRLNLRSTAIGREVQVQQLNAKPALVQALSVQTIESAPLNDQPDQLPRGDGKGAAGYDSALFVHLKTNWHKLVNNSYSRRLDKHRLQYVQRAIKLKQKKIKQCGNGASTSASMAQPTRSTMPVVVTRKLNRKSRIKKRIIVPRKQTARLWRESYDEVDKRALKLMSNLRVKWSPVEDQILVMCRVAQLYLYASLTVSCPVNSSTFRDVLHWANARSASKTSRACQRRVLYMVKNVPGVADMIRTCLEEAKQNPVINERFGPGFVRKLRKRYKDSEEYMIAARIHFVQLVHLIKQFCSNLIRNIDSAHAQTKPRAARDRKNVPHRSYPCIPGTIEELRRKYTITETSHVAKQLNYGTDPSTVQELQMYKLTILMHSAVTHGRTPEALQNVYREYSESILGGAMRLMRNFHLVSLNKKLRGVGTKVLITHTSSMGDRELYHVSIHYQQQLMTSLSFELFLPMFGQYMQLLDRVHYDEMQVYDDDAQGLVLLLSELLATGRVDVHIDQEANYIQVRADTKETVPFYTDVMAEQEPVTRKEEPSSSKKTSVKVANPFKAPSDKMNPATQKLRFSSQKDVTFQYVSHPVEQLLKVPIEYFHFFCLLEQLQQGDRRLIAQTFKIDETQPAHCSLSGCIGAVTKASGGGAGEGRGGVRSSDLIERCLAIVQGREDQLARIRQHGSDRAHRKNRVDVGTMFDVREENLLSFFNKYIAEFQQRWAEKQKRDFNRQSLVGQSFDKRTVNMAELVKDCLTFDDELPEYSWLDRYEMSNALEDEDVGETEQEDDRMYGSLTALSEKVFKLHNFYEVTIMKVHIRMKLEGAGLSAAALADREVYGQWSVPRCFLPEAAKSRRELLVKLTSDALWPAMEQLERPLHEAMSVIERNMHASALLAYIESKQHLGASVYDLAASFPNHAQLKQHLQALCGFKLLLRTGYRTITYVHWQYVEEWLTKAPVPEIGQRAEEQMGSSTSPLADTNTLGSKRKGTTLDVDEPTAKKPRDNIEGNLRQDNSTVGKHETRKSKRKYMLLAMAPWMKIDGTINKRLLFRWLTSILLYCVAHPGVPLSVLFVRFNMMPPFHLRQLLEVLQNYGCISLHSMRCTMKKTIFSVYSPATVVSATEFLPDEHTYVEVATDALSTLSLCIGDHRKYGQDFYDPSRNTVKSK